MIGGLSILCGVFLVFLKFTKQASYSGWINPERSKYIWFAATILVGLGFAELLAAEGLPLLLIRLFIGCCCSALAWFIKEGLVQTSLMMMGILMMIRAAMIYMGFNP